jgi:hypothetical protein
VEVKGRCKLRSVVVQVQNARCSAPTALDLGRAGALAQKYKSEQSREICKLAAQESTEMHGGTETGCNEERDF